MNDANGVDLDQALIVVRQAVTEVGTVLRPYYGNIDTASKADGSSISGVVTKLDREVEKTLMNRLSSFSADIGFEGEEFGRQRASDMMWLVDPIDGTAHFARGIPFCSTMVALIYRRRVILSVIYDFVNTDIYWAVRGKGAFCNDQRIHVSNRSLKQSLISFETRLDNPKNLKKYLTLSQQSGIISVRSSGFEAVMVATGKIDGRIGLEPYGQDWDFAPGSLLVREAGGIVTNIGESTYNYQNHNFIFANPVVYKELTQGKNALFPLGKGDMVVKSNSDG